MRTNTGLQKRSSPPKPAYDQGRTRQWLRTEQPDPRRKVPLKERPWARDR